jgi:hypothetical protein
MSICCGDVRRNLETVNQGFPGDLAMYTDAVVIAGIVTVLLMVGFFVGVGVFVLKDSKHKLGDHGRHSESPSRNGHKH